MTVIGLVALIHGIPFCCHTVAKFRVFSESPSFSHSLFEWGDADG